MLIVFYKNNIRLTMLPLRKEQRKLPPKQTAVHTLTQAQSVRYHPIGLD